MGRSGRVRFLTTVAVSVVLAASCGGGEPDTALSATDDARTASDQTEPTSRSERSTGVHRSTTTARSVPPPSSARFPGMEDLAFYVEKMTTTVVAAPAETTTTTVADAGSTTTQGSGAGPVTTKAPAGGGDVSIYQGVLGSIGPDEVIAPAVAPAPSVAPGRLPLTGLPGDVPNRPALVAKIDNGGRARPQTGLNAADIVIEEEVEGGITRFAVIFHSTSSIVGPVRSGRTTDIGILNGLGSPLLVYSGANKVTDALIRAQSSVQNRSAETSSGYWRNRSRRAPSNLYSDTAPNWASASGGPPPPQFAYRADGVAAAGADVSSFKVSYRASKAAWSWDGSAWLRTQGGAAHKTASGQQVSAANVVVIEARDVATGMVDSSGATVPEFVFVGTGKATVFTDGKRIDGVWTRPTLRSVATLTRSDGSVIELTPGRTWIELIRAGSGILK